MVGFDLEKYISTSKKIDVNEFDFSDARLHLLSEDEVRCLHYMMDVESNTIIYLRAVLRTCAVDDPETASFLCCWAYEEFFHGRTIREFLKASGVEVDPDRFKQVRRNTTFREWFEEMGASLMCQLTEHFHAAYLTWGAVQELTTLEAYGVLARRSRNPVLQSVVARIAKDERRHFSFYFNKARPALESVAAQRLTTLLLKRFWTPVGSGVKADPEVCWTIRYLFGDQAGAEVTHRIDSTIARLPGLGWFNMMGQARLSQHCSAQQRFPLLEHEGWLRHEENIPKVPIVGADGEVISEHSN